MSKDLEFLIADILIQYEISKMKRIALQYNFLILNKCMKVSPNNRKMDKTTVLKTSIGFLRQHNEMSIRSQVRANVIFVVVISNSNMLQGGKIHLFFNSAGRRDPNRLEADVSFK